MNHSSYLNLTLPPAARHASAERCVEAIEKAGLHPDFVAFTGLSGTLVGIEVAEHLGKPFALLRKYGEYSHGKHIEATLFPSRERALTYVIVDEFVASGRTVRGIVRRLVEDWTQEYYIDKNLTPFQPPICIGLILYGNTAGANIFTFPVFDAGLPPTQDTI